MSDKVSLNFNAGLIRLEWACSNVVLYNYLAEIHIFNRANFVMIVPCNVLYDNPRNNNFHILGLSELWIGEVVG